MSLKIPGFLMSFGLVLALAAADETKKDDKTDAKDKLVVVGQLQGTIQKMAEGGKGMTLRVYGRVPQSNGYRVIYRDGHEDHELTLADDTKVRVPPKQEVDEKGKPKNPVIKKDPNDPDRNLPGVKGAVSDLHQNQVVQVTLGRTREKQPRVLVMMVTVLGEK